MQTFPGKNKLAIERISLSGDGRLVATSNQKDQAHLWERDTGKLLYGPNDFPEDVMPCGAAVHSNSKHFFLWDFDSLTVYTIQTSHAITFPKVRNIENLEAIAATDDVVGMRMNEKRKTVFFRYAYKATTLKEVWCVDSCRRDFRRNPFCVSNDGKLFAAQNIPLMQLRKGRWVQVPSLIQLHDMRNGKLLHSCNLPPTYLLEAVANEDTILVSHLSRLMYWDVKWGEMTKEVRLKGAGRVRAVLSPDGRGIIAIKPKSGFQLDAASFEIIRELSFPLVGDLHSVAYSPDGTTAAVGTGKGQFAIWDVE